MKVNLNFIDSFRAKLETYRLEQRYARRDKRTTSYSTAQYVDGEYFYHPHGLSSRRSNSPVTTPSSTNSARPVPSVSATTNTNTNTTTMTTREYTSAAAPPSAVLVGGEARLRARMSMPSVRAEQAFASYGPRLERRASRAL